ncbi:MAG: hypothetical protein A2882_03800 [Phenylobacterium sp. RIFCSPHIGHO2_01_FULL_70_10]|nr:MAG: hypothetical protein A2882_03800 [Phenylobacterium sp. RIFCSPHIGHO2_01_FULL_70_10]
MKIAAVVTAAALALAGTAQAQEAFAPRTPSSLIDVLEAMEARAELDGMENGQVRLNVITPGGIFGAEFIGCDDKGAACKALGFTASIQKRTLTLDHLNDFNRRDILCRGVMSGDEANIRYGLLLTDNLTAADLREHVAVWQRCLGAFAALATDPEKFLGQD